MSYRSDRIDLSKGASMALVIVPVACDSHAVFTDYAQDGAFLGLYCEDCDSTYPPEAE